MIKIIIYNLKTKSRNEFGRTKIKKLNGNYYKTTNQFIIDGLWKTVLISFNTSLLLNSFKSMNVRDTHLQIISEINIIIYNYSDNNRYYDFELYLICDILELDIKNKGIRIRTK